ncbi:hypothetical protein [Cellulomonas wangsupingiae]|nr:hypothetical protein [Cellulomonas wangsupingiae]
MAATGAPHSFPARQVNFVALRVTCGDTPRSAREALLGCAA